MQQNVVPETAVQIGQLDADRGECTVVRAGSMKAYKGGRGLASIINPVITYSCQPHAPAALNLR